MLVSIEYTARRVSSKHTRYVNIPPEVVDIPADNILELFRFCQTEYGRSVRTIGIDTAQGRKTIGWVFEKRDEADPTRLMQAWVIMLYTKRVGSRDGGMLTRPATVDMVGTAG